MRAGPRYLLFAAVAALFLHGSAVARAYTPRLVTPEIPSLPPISARDAGAGPIGPPVFTLDPRMGFFAAGDPVNGMDPDGRLAAGFNAGGQFASRRWEGIQQGHIGGWYYDASGQQVVDWGNGQAFTTGFTSGANAAQTTGWLVGTGTAGVIGGIHTVVTGAGQALQSGINWLADITGQDPGIVELQVGVVSLAAAPLSKALRMQTAPMRLPQGPSSAPKIHGNRLDAPGPHDVYVMRDTQTGRIYHFGETGRGVETRGEEWARELQREHGLDTIVEPLRTVEGKAAAKALETRYIDTYEKIFGFKPRYVDEAGNFVPIQKTRH